VYYDPIRNIIVILKQEGSDGAPLMDELNAQLALTTMSERGPIAATWLIEGLSLAYQHSDISGPQDDSRLCVLQDALKSGTFPKAADIPSFEKLSGGDVKARLLEAAVRYFAIFLEGHSSQTNILRTSSRAHHAGSASPFPPLDSLDQPFQQFVRDRIAKSALCSHGS
jgi:hypothetical protein